MEAPGKREAGAGNEPESKKRVVQQQQ
eukprot:COSAG01_NODE_55624_length_323_cov_25.093750_1_plen_26_part_10